MTCPHETFPRPQPGTFRLWPINDLSLRIVSLDVGVSALSPGARTIDIDGDGTTDFSFRGNGGICTTDHPTSTCVFAVTVQGREGTEFLFGPAPGDPVRPLVAGDLLGGDDSPGVWGAPAWFFVHVSSVMRLLDPDPAGSGCAGFLDGLTVCSIGFRQAAGGGEVRYGWIDVGLFVPLHGGGDSTLAGIAIPRVLRLQHADTPGEEVAFAPVPEPGSTALLAAVAAALVLRRHRQSGGPGVARAPAALVLDTGAGAGPNRLAGPEYC